MNATFKKRAVGIFVATALALTQSPAVHAVSSEDLANQAVSADPTYSNFVSNLEHAAASGDAVAAENLEALSELTAEEKQRLVEYLKGGFEAEFDNSASTQQGDLRITTTQERSSWGSSTEHISTRTYVTFIKVKVIETQASGTYEVRNGQVDRILSHECDVTRNYDPLAEITTEKSDSFVSNNEASFLCHVTVKRGAPTPWGTISWSTRSATQGVVGDSDGRVVNSGWM